MSLDGNPYLNIASCYFAELDQLPKRRAALRRLSARLELTGSILLSPEGIRFSITGRQTEIDEFLEEIRKDPKLEQLEFNETRNPGQQLPNVEVRVKKEISSTESESRKADPLGTAGSLMPDQPPGDPSRYEESQKHDPVVSFPKPYLPDPEKTRLWLELRRESISKVIDPLPGSVPYENRRPIRTPKHADGTTVLDFLKSLNSMLPECEWLDGIQDGRLLLRNQPVAADHLLKAGDELIWIMPRTIEPEVNLNIRPIYEDDAILVIYKPAPLPMHPCGRFNRNSLDYVLRRAMQPYHPRPAHRLDANTCGLLVLAKTRQFAGRLQPQFETGSVFKEYLVQVEQAPNWKSIMVDHPISARPANSAGGRVVSDDGIPALTEFEALGPASDDSGYFILARPKTGRTNQIRTHLWSIGMPVKNDPHYLKGQQTGATQTLSMEDPPMCLCSYRLEFNHPISHERVRFVSPLPDWARSSPLDLKNLSARI